MNQNNTQSGPALWTNVATDLLRAELARRDGLPQKPACGSGLEGSYNTSAHVLALLLILALSTAACGFPLISKKASRKTGAARFIFISQHFGTGVLIATAFVHLLPTAFISLTDPCLPVFFSKDYQPLAGLIGMLSALIVISIEMFLTQKGARHSHSHGDWDSISVENVMQNHSHGTNDSLTTLQTRRNGRLGKLGVNRRSQNIAIALEDMELSEGLVAGVSPLPAMTPEMKPVRMGSHDNDSDSDFDLEEMEQLNHDIESNTPVSNLPPDQEQKRKMLQCLMLEAGILFHSIFIGMAVSVATGPPFVVFLVAISFHQSFEGLALGSRIAALRFPSMSIRPWLMVLGYGITTPIGQAIGLVVHRLYDPQSAGGLLMVGFMNAISSGLLLFAGLVQLLAEDFLSDKSYEILTGRKRWEAYAAVIAGALLMALVGAWA